MWGAVANFCDWLSSTPISNTFQTVVWVIPMVQSVHILAIAAVMSSVLLVDLRLLGLVGRSQPLAAVGRRYLPWIWWSLAVLLASGAILITAEPRRDLLNAVFQAKMALLVLAMSVTAVVQKIAHEPGELSPRLRQAAFAAAVVSLLAWTAIVACGRWIAYVEHG
jgi:uncharacterized membrane protein